MITLKGIAYDAANRVTRETNALGGVTALSYFLDASRQRVVTKTTPDGGIRVEPVDSLRRYFDLNLGWEPVNIGGRLTARRLPDEIFEPSFTDFKPF